MKFTIKLAEKAKRWKFKFQKSQKTKLIVTGKKDIIPLSPRVSSIKYIWPIPKNIELKFLSFGMMISLDI